jgi:hypothetical protein
MNIVQAIFMVALAGLLVAGGIQYISPDAGKRTQVAAQAEAGFLDLESAYRARLASGSPAPDPAAWQSALFPAYGHLPNTVSGLAWSYGQDGTGVWFCLSGAAPESAVRTALAGLSARMPAGAFTVTAACGGQGGDATPAAAAATLWMTRTGAAP